MKIALSTPRQMHAGLLLNTLIDRGDSVTFYTSTPRSRLAALDPAVDYRFAPKFLEIFAQMLNLSLVEKALAYDAEVYDRQVAARLPRVDLFYGWATVSLLSGRMVQRNGGLYVLDRACPFVDFQQSLVHQEAEKIGFALSRQPEWYRERQLEEYETADAIVVPSRYTRKSFPGHLQDKIIMAPICGRSRSPEKLEPRSGRQEFVVGVVGGDPLRKGYLYLLEAWKKLNLPNARLKIRSGSKFASFPALQKLISEQPNVELTGYVPDLNRFYSDCDVFVLPSVDDGFGMVLFEAMGNGVPCIATTHCGSSELLTPGYDGLVVEPFSAEQLAEAILTLYHSPDLRRTIGLQGRSTALRIRSGGKERVYDLAIENMMDKLTQASVAVDMFQSSEFPRANGGTRQ